MSYRIQLFRPAFDHAEIDAAKEVLESGWWASGPKTEEFESEFKKLVDCEEVIAVNSGTSAITLLLDYLDIKGKEVLTPAITFVGVVHAIVQNGGIPVFVDVGPDLCMDARDMRKKITEKTACVIPMHYGGRICEMNVIEGMADDDGIFVIEDACHAHGSVKYGKPAGSFGDYSFFSFHAVKPVAMPNGGCICLNRTGEEADELRSKRNFGIVDRRGPMYEVRHLGYNMYMNDVSAAIGLAQLDKLHATNTRRREIAATYVKELRGLDWVRMLPFDQGSSYHLFPVLAERPDSFVEWMSHRGIECGAHYPRIDEFKYYEKFKTALPMTARLSDKIVTIPCHPGLSKGAVWHIIESVKMHCNVG